MERKQTSLLHYATNRDKSDDKKVSAIRKSLASTQRECTKQIKKAE